jgi:hypothetical protein
MAISRKQDFITLKEAAELSGYSPDYLGQLIRNGKIEGQQVFLNTAWMTTKEAVLGYVEKSKGKKTSGERTSTEKVAMFWKQHWRDVSTASLYTIIVLNVIFLFFLLHLLSFSIEKHFEQRDLATTVDHTSRSLYVQNQ